MHNIYVHTLESGESMVSNTVIASIIIQLVLSILIPIIVLVYFRKKYNINWKIVGVGVLIFIGFTQILETPFHLFMRGNPATAAVLENPFIFAIYGGLTAGIFEELGRFVAFYYLLKKYREYKDGLAYGIGHGGIESILVGGFSALQTLIFATSINNGSFAQMVEKMPELSRLQDILIQQPAYLYLFGSLERIMALVLQIAFTMLVVYAVKQKKYIFLVYAILFHALVDFFAALYQTKIINIFVAEGATLLFAIGAFVLIRKMKEKLVSASE
ncbi:MULTISPECIES: YhfC family intramembrane metalloprotease [Bacillus]|uniref:YhfC family intramembrane metalloprotease n=1 Tax=Bacillus TaxID=1386 RepID=UPI0004682394|nr:MULTISPECIES: YhfC family intramembrane metalloprotease [Bacillus]MED1409253.1 YhfC family intramembrane metalloprotease [Bacillus paramycoides]MED1462845.1 YhfC family intramembrane metalloprotease [Bacillus paramycoides]MED1492463.1 YhfC family intramembrane metalloprotease [Bacillus paramycoides]